VGSRTSTSRLSWIEVSRGTKSGGNSVLYIMS
jgi:hypothetical protein